MYSLALNIKAEQIPWCEWIYFNLWIMQTENYKHDAKQAFLQFYTYVVFLNKIVKYKTHDSSTELYFTIYILSLNTIVEYKTQY